MPKVVFFWHMALDEEHDFKPNEEVDRIAWLTVRKAVKKLDFKIEKKLVSKSPQFKEGIKD